MKKKMASLLACALIFSAFTGCGDSTGSNSAINSENGNTPDEQSEAAEVTVDRSDFKIRSFDTSPTIEETVLVDENGVKITATGLEYNDYSAVLHLSIDNNTKSEIKVLANGGASVNNYMVPGYMLCRVPAGENTEDVFEFDYAELELYGMYEIATMGIHFEVSDSDYNDLVDTVSYLSTSIEKEYTPDTKSYQNSITDPQTIDQYQYDILSWATDTIFNQYGVQFTSELLMKNSDGDRIVMVEATNSNDVKISIGFDSLSINGDNINDHTFEWGEIDPGKSAIMSINIDDCIENEKEDVTEEYNDISEVKFNVDIYSTQDTIIEGEPLTIPFA